MDGTEIVDPWANGEAVFCPNTIKLSFRHGNR